MVGGLAAALTYITLVGEKIALLPASNKGPGQQNNRWLARLFGAG